MMTENDQTLGGKHIMQYTGEVLQNCTPETYVTNQCYSSEFNFLKKSRCPFSVFLI